MTAERPQPPLNIEINGDPYQRIAYLESLLAAKDAQIEELIRISQYDQLTGIGNDKYWESHLKRLKESRNIVNFFEIDVCNLKTTNDTYGHAAGDQILKSVAEIIKKSVRPDDIFARVPSPENPSITDHFCPNEPEIIARVGGDEFWIAIVTPVGSKFYPGEFVTRILAKKDEYNKTTTYPVNFAIGFDYSIPPHNFIESKLIADRSLYQKKKFFASIDPSSTRLNLKRDLAA